MTIAAIYGAKATLGALGTIIGITDVISSDVRTLKSYKNNTSLIDVSSGTRVEPLTIVGTDCIHLPYISDVLQSTLSIFAGYYLQAVAMTTQVNGVAVSKLLDRLNPDRKGDLIGASLSVVSTNSTSDWKLNSLSYQMRLPTTTNKNAMAFEQQYIALETTPTAYNRDQLINDQIQATTDIYNDRNSRDAAIDKSINKQIKATTGIYNSRNERDHLSDVHGIQMNANRDARANQQHGQDLRHNEDANSRRNDETITRLRNESEQAFDQRKKMAKDEIDRDKKNRLQDEEQKKKELEEGRDKTVRIQASITSDQIKSIREVTDLSVGRMFNVTLGGGVKSNGDKVLEITVPISIRLMVNAIPDASLVPLLCGGTADASFKERYHAYKSGRIEFIRDLILCQDLIDEHKKAMMHDHTGIHSQIISRVNNNKLAGLANRDPSLNVASNLYVISEVTAKEIEHKLGGKLSNHGTRDKIFDSGYAMIIVVIDRQWERMTFYHRGIATSTTVSLKDIQMSNKKSGPDVGDILKAYMAGSSPQF